MSVPMVATVRGKISDYSERFALTACPSLVAMPATACLLVAYYERRQRLFDLDLTTTCFGSGCAL